MGLTGWGNGERYKGYRTLSTRIVPIFTIILVVVMFAFVTGQSISHNYQDFGYLYVNVHASAGVSGTGEDVNGDYTDYWAYGSTSLSTPSSIEGDNNYGILEVS